MRFLSSVRRPGVLEISECLKPSQEVVRTFGLWSCAQESNLFVCMHPLCLVFLGLLLEQLAAHPPNAFVKLVSVWSPKKSISQLESRCSICRVEEKEPVLQGTTCANCPVPYGSWRALSLKTTNITERISETLDSLDELEEVVKSENALEVQDFHLFIDNSLGICNGNKQF